MSDSEGAMITPMRKVPEYEGSVSDDQESPLEFCDNISSTIHDRSFRLRITTTTHNHNSQPQLTTTTGATMEPCAKDYGLDELERWLMCPQGIGRDLIGHRLHGDAFSSYNLSPHSSTSDAESESHRARKEYGAEEQDRVEDQQQLDEQH